MSLGDLRAPLMLGMGGAGCGDKMWDTGRERRKCEVRRKGEKEGEGKENNGLVLAGHSFTL